MSPEGLCRLARASGTWVLVLAVACAPPRPPAAPGPERIGELELAVRADTMDAGVRLRLAAAYHHAGRAQDVVPLLEPVVARGGQPGAALQLGAAYEELGRLADARRLYTAYIGEGSTPELRRRVQQRLALLERLELEQAVRNAIAREEELRATDPPPRTVGVFPFLTTAGESLEPLGRALAELLSTDLGRTDRLTVLERASVQLLLDEIELAETGVADPATAARAGRIVGAASIVQGRIDGDEQALRVQALIVPVGAAGGQQASPIAQQGALRQLFDMQAALALSLYGALGVELTVAERERVAQRPTENVQALLAFGFGLEAEDGGRWVEAAQQFRRAVELDPNFEEARLHLEQAEATAQAQQDSPAELSTFALLELDDVAEWLQRRRRFAGVDEMVPNPEGRDPISEVLNVEGLERRIFLEIVIRRPGGSQ